MKLHLPSFIEYLKVAVLFGAIVADCPLSYASPIAPQKRDLLGATMFAVLARRKRCAHLTAPRNGGVLPQLLVMSKIVLQANLGPQVVCVKFCKMVEP